MKTECWISLFSAIFFLCFRRWKANKILLFNMYLQFVYRIQLINFMHQTITKLWFRKIVGWNNPVFDENIVVVVVFFSVRIKCLYIFIINQAKTKWSESKWIEMENRRNEKVVCVLSISLKSMTNCSVLLNKIDKLTETQRHTHKQNIQHRKWINSKDVKEHNEMKTILVSIKSTQDIYT